MSKDKVFWGTHPDASKNSGDRGKLDSSITEHLIGSIPATRVVNNAIYDAGAWSDEFLIRKVNDRKELDYTTLGYLIELKQRKVPSIPGPYRNVYKEVTPSIEKNLQRLDGWNRDLVQTGIIVGALLSNVVAGKVLSKVVSKDEQDKVIEFADRINKEKNLGVTLKNIENSLESHFNPETKAVVTGPDLAIASHEFGHAENLAAYQRIFGEKRGKTFGQLIYATPNDYAASTLGPLGDIPIAGLALAPLASSHVTNLIKGNDEKSTRYRIGSAIADHPDAVIAAAVTPKLLEEASASVRGISNMMKYAPEEQKAEVLKAGLKKLGPAFLTYLTAAMIPYALGHYAKGIHDDKKKQDLLLDSLRKNK